MDQTQYEEDNTKNCLLESDVPDLCKTEPCWLGIDEAGRGPVLGPMVYGTCYSPLSKKEDLKDLGFADSKTLTEEQREKIFEMLHENGHLIGWMVDILSPTYISNSMLKRTKYNLNALSHDCAIGLIEKVIKKGVNVAEIYVDTVGDPTKYQDKLKRLFPHIDITVAKKADADYQIVGAASICAKVARDKAVKNWKFIEGLEVENNYGSGYPSDPNTKKFMSESLDKVFGFPQFVRVSWSTASNIIDKKAVMFKCAIKKILNTLSTIPQDDLLRHYDRHGGRDNAARLAGVKHLPIPAFEVGWGVKQSALRVLSNVIQEGRGYFEERRPF